MTDVLSNVTLCRLEGGSRRFEISSFIRRLYCRRLLVGSWRWRHHDIWERREANTKRHGVTCRVLSYTAVITSNPTTPSTAWHKRRSVEMSQNRSVTVSGVAISGEATKPADAADRTQRQQNTKLCHAEIRYCLRTSTPPHPTPSPPWDPFYDEIFFSLAVDFPFGSKFQNGSRCNSGNWEARKLSGRETWSERKLNAWVTKQAGN